MIIGLFNKLINLPLRYTNLFNMLFMARSSSKMPEHMVTGTLILCQSGRFVAFYDHRSDMTASGNTEKECLRNLKKMYNHFLKAEEEGKIEKPIDDMPLQLPDDWQLKKFTDKVSRI